MSLIETLLETLLEKPANLSIASRYTVMNGIVYLSAGALLILWPGAVQAMFRDRAFEADEQGLVRALGMAVVVIGWLYLFAGRSGSRQAVAASVIDRLTIVPLVLLPLAAFGIFPHLFIFFAVLDMSLGIGAWVLLRHELTQGAKL
jgi:hypothetical protein